MISTKSNVLASIIGLEGSTTLLLELIKGKHLQVEIVSQREELIQDHCYIKRTTKLFFDTPDEPALYCISYLDKKVLTSMEYYYLMQKNMPIGKLFIHLNTEEGIKKNNITVVVEEDEEISCFLKVNSAWLYKKKYDYWVDGRKIGNITEMFNEESLHRINNHDE